MHPREWKSEEEHAKHLAMKQAFRSLRARAERTDIDWRLTLSEFIELWRDHWDTRKDTGVFLARIGYRGTYELGNVQIATRSEHVASQHYGGRSEEKTEFDSD